ncbi:MAG: 6-pyruvoyl trahydropterin synthase family protein [Flavobacteriales bacterium]
MRTVRLSKEFTFESAHALDGYDGKCVNIHGHSYELIVTVKGTPISDENHVKLGMVMDFSELKSIVKDNIISVFDHALILKSDSRFRGIEEKHQNVVYKPYQPTCENMIIDFAEILLEKLPNHVKLHALLLRETGTSYAEWFAEDNL